VAFSILRFDMRAPGLVRERTRELYEAALDMAAWADGHGFDAITLSEHHATEDGFLPSPLVLAGCMLGRTRRIRVGIAALLVPLYDPVKLAEDLAILDVASAGRLAVTAGLGYRPDEYAMFGRDWKGRGRLFDDCLDVLLRAWTGEVFEWQGRRVHLTPPPYTQPHPPILVGGTSLRAARRAARLGLPFQPATNDPAVIACFVEESRRRGVENPLVLPPGSGETIFVSRDPDRTWARIGEHLLHDARTYASWQPADQRSAVHSHANSVAGLRAEGLYRVLTPDECVARARERGPFCDFVHFPLCGGMPPEHGWESLELYASEVLPRIG
jgi:alkanesulfonate monooxygenase SsuD/methylene tetrahydromethanopterin reductase-like flavin-dependent oxidoreductase (luciferase family)